MYKRPLKFKELMCVEGKNAFVVSGLVTRFSNKIPEVHLVFAKGTYRNMLTSQYTYYIMYAKHKVGNPLLCELLT